MKSFFLFEQKNFRTKKLFSGFPGKTNFLGDFYRKTYRREGFGGHFPAGPPWNPPKIPLKIFSALTREIFFPTRPFFFVQEKMPPIFTRISHRGPSGTQENSARLKTINFPGKPEKFFVQTKKSDSNACKNEHYFFELIIN